MALTLFWRCEGTTLDGTNDYSVNDTVVDNNATAAISGTGAKVGSNGVVAAATNDYYAFENGAGTKFFPPESGAIGCWFNVQTWRNLSGPLLARGASYNDIVALYITGSAGSGNVEFRLKEDATPLTLATTGANLTTGTWYFVYCAWDQAAPSRFIGVYDSSGTLIASNTSSAAIVAGNLPGTMQQFRVGAAYDGGSGGFVGYVDNVFAGDAFADGAVFLSKRDITSYTQYAGASPARFAPYANQVISL